MDVLPDHELSPGSGPPASNVYAVLQTLCGAGGVGVACVLGLIPTLRILCGGAPESVCHSRDAAHGAFCVGLDALSAFFLLPVLGLSALAAVYGGNYMLAYRGTKSLA